MQLCLPARMAGVLCAVASLAAGAVSGGEMSPIVAAFERFHRGPPPTTAGEGGDVAGGLLLLNELNCVACHEIPDTWREHIPGRGKISLRGIGERMDEAGLRAFVIAPQHLKPGTTMPALVRDDAAAADAIVAYLSSLKAERPPKHFPAGDVTRGEKLFASIGCVACHAPVGGTAVGASVPLALSGHYGSDALAEFLQDPLHLRPAGRMPAFELSDVEAADLAAFLKANATRVDDPLPVGTRTNAMAGPGGEPRVEPSGGDLRLERGRELFATRGCAACHDDGGAEHVRNAQPLARVRVEQGCLAERPAGAAPDFALDAEQRRVFGDALRAIQTERPPELTAEHEVAEAFARLNCYACHEWRGRGGVAPGRAAHFTATEGATESLGELARLPPNLDAAGRKLTPAWLEKLLAGAGGGVRPYMSARMPRFGAAAADALIPLLAEACRPETPLEIDTSGTKGHQRSAAGRTLIGTGEGGLSCVACHGLKDREPSGVRAINLTHTVRRLQPEYFKALLLDPQGIQPGTIMPPLFAGRKNAGREIESLWTYLKEMDQSPRLPEGLSAPDSFELKPEAEGRPIVFRTFLEGAGTHAIAVGFPARRHIAFDAFEVRWAIAWRGRFLDALANWEERTMPPVKPLGEATRMLPEHMPFARLNAATEPWPETWGTAAGYRFQGYRLEEDGTPVFRYAVDGLEIEDAMRPAANGTVLRRTMRIRGGNGGNWFFRGLANGAVPQPLVFENGAAIIEEEISL